MLTTRKHDKIFLRQTYELLHPLICWEPLLLLEISGKLFCYHKKTALGLSRSREMNPLSQEKINDKKKVFCGLSQVL